MIRELQSLFVAPTCPGDERETKQGANSPLTFATAHLAAEIKGHRSRFFEELWSM